MFKRTVVRKVTGDAERRTFKGEKQVKYRLDGSLIWVKDLGNGKALVPSACYFARVGGKLTKLARDKSASQLMLADLLRHGERVAVGIDLPRRSDRETVAAVVDRYIRTKADQGVKAPRLAALRQRIGDFIRHLGAEGGSFEKFRKLISPESMEKYADSLTGTSSTRLAYVIAIKGLFKWLEADGYTGKLPTPRRPKAVIERGRRVLTQDELSRLFRFAPPIRSIFYRLAVATIARKGSLLAATPEDFDLDASAGATLTLRAETSKTGKSQVVPIGPDLVPDLRRLIAVAKPGRPIFSGTGLEASTNVFRRDLAKAGVPVVTREGHAVLHSLRHTGTTILVKAGVSLLAVQKLGGWETLGMLSRHYGHLEPCDVRGLITSVMRPITGATTSPAASITGGDLPRENSP